MGSDKTDRLLKKTMKAVPHIVTPIATDMVLPNHSGNVKEPIRGGDLANKDYVDASAGAVEGVDVLSTGEAGATKFLREDGDGTCSWQTPSGSGDMTKAIYDTDSNDIVDSSEKVLGVCRKGSAGTIALGSPVYISGYNVGGWVEVEEADADDSGKMPAVGIAAESITNSATATFIHAGGLETDTSAWSVGDEVWVSTTAGALTNTKPTGTAAIQKMGIVMRSHAINGQLGVFGAGRSNDVPNIPSNEFWLGNGSAVATATNFDTEVSANVDVAANKVHAADNTQAHSDYLLNSGADSAVGPITITADNSSADTAYVPMVLYNTDATPPAANTVPVGTIYIQYTA